MSENNADLKGMNILIVDDVPNNIDVLRYMLGDNGFVISVAPNGETALTLAGKNKPDLILLDVMMPGINGFETCKRLKKDGETAHIPVIFITARTEIEAVVEGFRAGGVDYITKPFNQEEVLTRVTTHLKNQKLLHEQKKLNERLQNQNDELVESKNQFNIIIEKTADGIFRLDREGKIVQANHKFCSALGYRENQISGMPVKELVRPDTGSEAIQQLATRRSRDRATSGLELNFCVNKNSPLYDDHKHFTMCVDSFGIWNLSNTVVMEKGVDKVFLGTICIVKHS